MATIHLARLLGAQGFSRTVAVKQLHPQFAQNPQFVAMLLDEARLAVRVRHGNVISPLDIVVTGSELFIVMDYVNGESFANLLVASAGPLRPGLAAAVLVQVLLGLHAAHEATREQGEALGLVHRDVSPQNILVGQDGVARVLDFGIAKAVARKQTTDGGMVKGKLGYLAPEQIRLDPVDRRADLFSAGVVLWEALTGTGLFSADTLGASIELVLHGRIVPPSQLNPAVTPELDAVVLKALERDRDARYPDAMSMATALESAMPPASALEVIDWVEKLAGPDLAHKADLVRRAEALSWEPEHALAPTLSAAPTPPGASASVTGQPEAVAPSRSASVSPSSKPAFPKRTLKGIARPPLGQEAGSALMATRDLTGVALGSDREASATTEARTRRDWKWLRVALGVAAAAGTVTLGGSWALSRGERANAIGVVRQTVDLDSRSSVAMAAPAPQSARLVAADAPVSAPSPGAPRVRPVPSPVAASVSLQHEPPPTGGGEAAARTRAHARTGLARAEPGVRAVPGARASASRTARHADAAEASPSRPAAKAESRPMRSATATGDPLGLAPTSNGCKPPWIINEHQIKVFKEECLR